MILGLSTRYITTHLPSWINLYLGDILWALMIFFLFGLIFRNRETRWISALAFIFSFSIEISQLYHSQWIDTLRSTRLGGLVLGYGFLWSDLISYSAGIGIGVFIERTIIFNKLR
jgi:glycopeptide antibiotics resistance protein